MRGRPGNAVDVCKETPAGIELEPFDEFMDIHDRAEYLNLPGQEFRRIISAARRVE